MRRFDLSKVAGADRSLVIGRADDCDIRIKSGAVSRKHCELLPDGEEWILRDLGSSYGCHVNGQRVDEVDVEAGLEVRIGPAKLRFDSVASRIAADLAKDLGEDDAGSE